MRKLFSLLTMLCLVASVFCNPDTELNFLSSAATVISHTSNFDKKKTSSNDKEIENIRKQVLDTTAFYHEQDGMYDRDFRSFFGLHGLSQQEPEGLSYMEYSDTENGKTYFMSRFFGFIHYKQENALLLTFSLDNTDKRVHPIAMIILEKDKMKDILVSSLMTDETTRLQVYYALMQAKIANMSGINKLMRVLKLPLTPKPPLKEFVSSPRKRKNPPNKSFYVETHHYVAAKYLEKGFTALKSSHAYSCFIVSIYDLANKIAVMGHIYVPGVKDQRMFFDKYVDNFLSALEKKGGSRENLKIWIIGGSSVSIPFLPILDETLKNKIGASEIKYDVFGFNLFKNAWLDIGTGEVYTYDAPDYQVPLIKEKMMIADTLS